MLKKSFCLISFILIIGMLLPFCVSAGGFNNYKDKSQYYSYEYNSYGEMTTAPDGYYADRIVPLNDMGIDMEDSLLTDLYYDGTNIFVLDGGKGRVIVLNRDFTFSKIISPDNIKKPSEYENLDLDFTDARGIYKYDDELMICDSVRERVLIIKDDMLVGVISRPGGSVLSKKIKFDATRVVKAGNNYYVAAESVISGVLVFNESFEFVRFFGGNKVTVTSEVLLHALQSIYMSDQQIAARRKFSASKITGMDVDKTGFIVVVSSDTALTVAGSAVRCLNYKGSDIAGKNDDKFGDKDITVSTANIFTDVSVDEDNFYSILDKKYGRVFVYSDDGTLVCAFGGIGNALGFFKTPVAVETAENDILVLDDADNSFTVFKPADYGKVKKDLLSVINTGNYKKIDKLSRKLLKYNTNCQYAYYAMGFVAESKGDYATAMSYYKQANKKDAYSQCYKLWRSEYVKKHFGAVLLVIVAIIAAIIVGVIYLNKGLTKKTGMTFAPLEGKKGYPLYCMFHPADGFVQIKQRKVLSPVWLVGILLTFVYISVMRFFTMGFIHNENRAQDFNVLISLAKTVGIVALFIIANWAICTLMDGKGKPREIIYTVVYSLIPYVFALIVTLLLSLFLTADESAIMSIIMAAGEVWTGLILFVGLISIHEYSVGKGIFSIFLTLIGMTIILLLLVMFFTLISQTFSFVQSVVEEYSLRH